jgi:hypothetical protein
VLKRSQAARKRTGSNGVFASAQSRSRGTTQLGVRINV